MASNNYQKLVFSLLAIFSCLTTSGVGSAQDLPNFESKWCKESKKSMQDYTTVRSDLIEPLNDFSLRLWKISSKASANPALSPWSIYTTLSMVLVGAKSDTATEIAKTLGLPKVPNADWHHLTKGIALHLLCPDEDVTTEFNAANGLYVQKGKGFERGFTELLEAAYAAHPIAVDFNKDPEGARAEINKWVSDVTEKRIPNLIPKNMIDTQMKLVLANAVFIKGGWKKSFPEKATKAGDFYLSKSQKISTKMMRVEGNARDFSYAKGKNFQAVNMDTGDYQVSMVVVLPDAKDGLAELESQMTGKKFDRIFQSLKRSKVNITFPKFSASADWDLVDSLKKMGMKKAFIARQANFNGIDGGKDLLYISNIAHKATVNVNEKGFEAAAATAIMMRAGGMPPKPMKPIEFVVDHPFMYFIRDNRSGAILFVGVVNDPSKE